MGATLSEIDAIVGLLLTGVAPGGHAPTARWRRQGEAYHEQRIGAARVDMHGTAAELTFQVPAEQRPDFVSLTASSVPGQYRVSSVRANGSEISDFAARIMGMDGSRVEAGAASVLVAHARQAPRIELDMRGLDCETLQMRTEREDGHIERDAIVGAIAEVARNQARAETRAIEAQLSLGLQLDALQQQLRATHVALIDAISLEAQRTNAGIEQLDALQQQLRATHVALIDAISLEAQRTNAGIDRLETSTARDAVRAGELEQGIRNLAESLRQVEQAQRQQFAQIEAHGAVLARVANGIENVFWRRWIARLRRLPR